MKNKTVSILLALFLGGLGLHHFYLGHWGRGILYLLFCWTGVPAVLGVIDAIYYLVAGGKDFGPAPSVAAPSVTPPPVAPPVQAVPMQDATPATASQPQNTVTIVGAVVENPKEIEQKQEEEVSL